jgi:hypothetical protein
MDETMRHERVSLSPTALLNDKDDVVLYCANIVDAFKEETLNTVGE